jgi:hypothetical protein
MTNPRLHKPLALEIVLVWSLFAIVAVEMVVTYSRLPAHELYHVTGGGLSGGPGRALVFSNFPLALVAISILALLFEKLPSRATQATALVALVLCAVVFWPGVVDQAKLDAKWINALPGLGVLIAIALTATVGRNGAAWSGRQPGDRLRIVVAGSALFVALPWIAAELGFYLDRGPALGRLFQTGVHPHAALLPAVHHGHHHGMDGVLLLLTAALLSRVVPSVRDSRLRVAVGLYLALMASYGIANLANDFWGEQILKRDWTTWVFPNVLRPNVTTAWGLIVLGATALYAAAAWWSRRSGAEPAAFNPVADV